MPYPNMPKKLWPLMERCVGDVKEKSPDYNPYAVCYTSIMDKHAASVLEDAADEIGNAAPKIAHRLLRIAQVIAAESDEDSFSFSFSISKSTEASKKG